jgi:UPF0716 protein FxsA
MRYFVFAMLVGFPALDLYVSLRVAHWAGVPLWAWLAVSTAAGFLLMRSERGTFRANTVAALRGDQPLFRGLLDSGRKVLAAFLLLMPGIVSDLLALVLLSLPINTGRQAALPLHPQRTR